MEEQSEGEGMMVSEGVRLPLMPLNCTGQTFPAPNIMTKNQQARALAKTQATIQQVTIEAEQAARAERQRIVAENCQRAREEKKEREFRKWLKAKEVEWEAARAKECRKAELFEEWQRLSDRYDRLFTNVCKFSDAAIRQFEQDAGTKAILDRIKQIDAEYAAIK